MAPVNKNIVFEIVDDFELDINTDDEKKTNENKNNKMFKREYERHEALSDDDAEIIDEILEKKREK
jgi:hypothetical protein